MQEHYDIKTLADAYAVVFEHDLDSFDWAGLGTADGFAAMLYVNGNELNSHFVEEAIEDYRSLCESEGTDKVDAWYGRELLQLRTTIDSALAGRKKASKTILEWKLSDHGKPAWNALAALATATDRQPIVDSLDADVCRRAIVILDGFAGLRDEFIDSDAFPYRPGENLEVDRSLELGIQRFDVGLEIDEPWDGREPDLWFEAAALLRLLKATPVKVELTARIGTSRAVDGVPDAAVAPQRHRVHAQPFDGA